MAEKLHIQAFLPELEASSVTGTIRVHWNASGQVVIGYSVDVTGSNEVLALGATAPLTANEALGVAQDLVRQFYGVLPTLCDAPPFD